MTAADRPSFPSLPEYAVRRLARALGSLLLAVALLLVELPLVLAQAHADASALQPAGVAGTAGCVDAAHDFEALPRNGTFLVRLEVNPHRAVRGAPQDDASDPAALAAGAHHILGDIAELSSSSPLRAAPHKPPTRSYDPLAPPARTGS